MGGSHGCTGAKFSGEHFVPGRPLWIRNTVKQEFDDSADPTGQARQMQAMMFGPNGMQSRVVYQKDKFITTMGGGKEAMTEALKAVDSATKSEAVTQYRKGPIESPNILFLVDVPGLAVQGMRVASAIPGVPLNIITTSTSPASSVTLDKLHFKHGSHPHPGLLCN